MKTICIKTNNLGVLNYLLENFKKIQLDGVYISLRKFRVYNNIFIHFKGKDSELFLSTISHFVVFSIFDFYEETILEKILDHEYFYFDSIEKREILNIAKNNIENNTNIFTNKETLLFNIIYNFLKNHNTIYLKGFITFRIKKYINLLEEIIEEAVNEYIVEKEYSEFVSLLKLYINSETSKIDFVHLIYSSKHPILLDKNKNIIKSDINFLNAKYLSDISFSSFDMILNTLLNILPQKIYIHLIDDKETDFLETLKLIFENRIILCTDCNICRLYKSNRNKIKER